MFEALYSLAQNVFVIGMFLVAGLWLLLVWFSIRQSPNSNTYSSPRKKNDGKNYTRSISYEDWLDWKDNQK